MPWRPPWRPRLNPDVALRRGVQAFLSGGNMELPGEVLVRIRDAATHALKSRGLIPSDDGPVADSGFVWIWLEDAEDFVWNGGRGLSVHEVVRGWNQGEFTHDPEYLIGEVEEWGLAGPAKRVHLVVHDLELTGDLYYEVWVEVPEVNLGRVGRYRE